MTVPATVGGGIELGGGNSGLAGKRGCSNILGWKWCIVVSGAFAALIVLCVI